MTAERSLAPGSLLAIGRVARAHGLKGELRVETFFDGSDALDQVEIPSFTAVQATCVYLHQTIPELDLISWDMAVDRRGAPVVLEFNIRRQDINYNQVCNGPVLGPYIDAVLAHHKWHVIPGIGAIDEVIDMDEIGRPLPKTA